MEEAEMTQFDPGKHVVVGPGGRLAVPPNDEIARKLLMLIEGECGGAGPIQAAKKFHYSKQRYFQLRAAFQKQGSASLQSRKRGPKTNYRRTAEVVMQVIRHRFLDPQASPAVIAQKLRQNGWTISLRSVERIIADYALQKKTPQVPPRTATGKDRNAHHSKTGAAGRRRSAQHRTGHSSTTRR
jgi:hypothetical protein